MTSIPAKSAANLVATPDPVGPRALARSVEIDGSGSMVRAGAGDGRSVTCRFPVRPDVAAARRWLAALRRIDVVEISTEGRSRWCRVRGVGHRRDVDRPVALATALGLGVLGVPVVVDLGGV